MSARRTPDAHRIAGWMSEISLRLAGPSDRAELERLAILDERPLPPAPHLLARSDGELTAALSLATGEIVADPFRRTAEVQRLLEAHAAGARVEPGALPATTARTRPRPPKARAGAGR
jgi:hypothetical protein